MTASSTIAEAEKDWILARRRELAARLARHVAESSGSQSEIAQRLGIPQPTLSLVVRGQVRGVSLELLLKLCRRAGISVSLDIEWPQPFVCEPLKEPVRLDPETGRPYSKVAAELRASRRAWEATMTPEERLELFLKHNEALEAIRQAGAEALGTPTRAKGTTMKSEKSLMASTELLCRVLPLLEEADIKYLTMGAYALALHGHLRATRDVDVLLGMHPSQLRAFRQKVQAAGFQVDMRLGDEHDPIPAVLEIRDAAGGLVEMLAGLRGLDPAAFARGLTVPFSGNDLKVVGREDLIAMKCYAGRPQDLIDVKEALAGSREGINEPLLRELVRRFGRRAVEVLESIWPSVR